MSQEATMRETEDAAFSIEDGAVLLTDGSTSVVRMRCGDVRARRAESCLVEPAPKDRVLVARSGDEAFVLAVLSRDKPGAVRIAADAPIEIVSKKGDVSLVAGGDVSILAGKSTSVTAPDLVVNASRGRARVDDLGFVGKIATVGVSMLKTVADAAEHTAGRLVERLGRSYRFVEETEHVRARDIDMRTEHNLQLRGEHTVVVARKVVKVDGTQIHMG
ncbi:MAG TPA: DUF3540 domain-containing protein [Polyangiaceae bacterium]|jgi:hypothetical protein|nr:DUF3540 domain-containing protein [Polyangiaceae bacterium]